MQTRTVMVYVTVVAPVSGAGPDIALRKLYNAPKRLLGAFFTVFSPAFEKAAEGRKWKDAHHKHAEGEDGGEREGGGRTEKSQAGDHEAGGRYR